MKKGIWIIAALICVLGVTVISFASINSGLFVRDKILEEHAEDIKKTKVDVKEQISIKDEKTPADINIIQSKKIADDGSMIFEVVNNGKVMGSFYYKPWLENRPVFTKLENGDFILGKTMYYSTKEQVLKPLAGEVNLSIFDYDVLGNKVALIGKQDKNNEAIMKVFIYNIETKEYAEVDSFKYPNYMHQETVLLCWKSNEELFYDYCEGTKPLIKSYNTHNGDKKVFMDSAMNPQISPQGNYMVLLKISSLNKSDRTIDELQLVDVSKKEKITKVNGSKKIFWHDDLLFVKNMDEAVIEVLDCKAGGKKIKSIPMADMPVEIKVSNNNVKIKSYKFNEGMITLNEVDEALK
ncbi:MAG: hypothetical protein PWR27_2379 [Petroclostridium sp.]|jgi:hypothetical protein|uniref:hypothetical protein n=1 Tax=Petroclostridium xylanilyticum TaxID=1792311 RepID=UPI000B97EEFC|nr:hypothetical protein [Petroclostridium xylanilyticum]MBZ4646935.1 hypothetical protein [Clostridia bacterium]MDK2811670.1 hypothetical protein [Petroclostridium sp.]